MRNSWWWEDATNWTWKGVCLFYVSYIQRRMNCVCVWALGGGGNLPYLALDTQLNTPKVQYDKSVYILQQTCYQKADIKMGSHGLQLLVEDKSVASCQQPCWQVDHTNLLRPCHTVQFFLQCNSTLGKRKTGKYMFPSQFADTFLTYQTFVTNLHLLRVQMRTSCKKNCTLWQGLLTRY